jgi:uncharacterized protein
MNDTPQVRDDPAASRFVAEVDGQVAELVYHLDGDRMVLVHTGVPAAIERRGIGGSLVAAAVGEARRRGLAIVPQCPFTRHWLRHHPEAAATVETAGQGTAAGLPAATGPPASPDVSARPGRSAPGRDAS